MILFKPWVGKMILGQITGEFTVITPIALVFHITYWKSKGRCYDYSNANNGEVLTENMLYKSIHIGKTNEHAMIFC